MGSFPLSQALGMGQSAPGAPAQAAPAPAGPAAGPQIDPAIMQYMQQMGLNPHQPETVPARDPSEPQPVPAHLFGAVPNPGRAKPASLSEAISQGVGNLNNPIVNPRGK